MRRYDAYGLDRPEPSPRQIIPRIYLPGQINHQNNNGSPVNSMGSHGRLPSELSTMSIPRIPRIHRHFDVPQDIDDIHEAPFSVPPPQSPPLVSLRSQEGSQMVVDPMQQTKAIERNALFRNPCLGYQRFLFTLSKYPALVMVMLSTWTLWGRGYSQEKISNEKSSAIAGFATGIFVLASVIFVSLDHNHNYRRAKILSNIRHFVVVTALCAAVAVLVLSASSVKPLSNFRDNITTPTLMPTTLASTISPTPSTIFSPDERINNQAVMIGTSMMLILFSLCTLVFGCTGLFQMEKKLSEEKRRRRNTTAYENPTMQF